MQNQVKKHAMRHVGGWKLRDKAKQSLDYSASAERTRQCITQCHGAVRAGVRLNFLGEPMYSYIYRLTGYTITTMGFAKTFLFPRRVRR